MIDNDISSKRFNRCRQQAVINRADWEWSWKTSKRFNRHQCEQSGIQPYRVVYNLTEWYTTLPGALYHVETSALQSGIRPCLVLCTMLRQLRYRVVYDIAWYFVPRWDMCFTEWYTILPGTLYHFETTTLPSSWHFVPRWDMCFTEWYTTMPRTCTTLRQLRCKVVYHLPGTLYHVETTALQSGIRHCLVLCTALRQQLSPLSQSAHLPTTYKIHTPHHRNPFTFTD